MVVMNKHENRKLLLITRIILFVIGFALGFLAMWQVLDENTGIAKRLIIKILFYAVGGLVPGTVLALSAKPVYYVFAAFGNKIRSRTASVKANDIAAVMLGALIGTLTGFGAEMLLRLFLKIIALRVFIIILISVIAVYISVILCSQWLKSVETLEYSEKQPVKKKDQAETVKGFLLTASVFGDARVITLCEKWLAGKKYVLDGTDALLEEKAKDNYASLSDVLNCIEMLPGGGRVKAEEDAAREMSLKIIVQSAQDALNYSAHVSLLILDEL